MKLEQSLMNTTLLHLALSTASLSAFMTGTAGSQVSRYSMRNVKTFHLTSSFFKSFSATTHFKISHSTFSWSLGPAVHLYTPNAAK